MTAIEFENVGKQYRLGLVSTQTLSHDLNRWWTVNVLHKEDPYLKIGEVNDRSVKGSSDYVWALRDINFKVEQGDVVGIIGRNGAGKSTLLKLLSRVTAPTTGHIRGKGRIGSLLEVGTGFHPEMTGRENIYMNGAILGMTKPEITRKLDEIVDFSGCERYLDTPVKRYSSGMMVRLGFAVAAHLDPEILVVDEVLAVGDAEFQKKAIGKMQDVSRGEGRTVLFVSHNMASIRNLCNHGILLENGMIKYIGDIEPTIDKYLSSEKVIQYDDLMQRFLGKELPESYIRNVYFLDELGNRIDNVLSGNPLDIVVEYHNGTRQNIDVNLGIYDNTGVKTLRLGTPYVRDSSMDTSAEGGLIRFHFEKCPLVAGSYMVNVSLWVQYQRLDLLQNAVMLNVVEGDYYNSGKIPVAGECRLLVDFECTAE